MTPDAPARLVRQCFALLREANITDRRERINLFRWMLHDPSVNSTDDLNERELQLVVDMLRMWKRQGDLEAQCCQHIGSFRYEDG